MDYTDIKCLTVLPIGKWFIIPAGIAFLVFLLFALYLIQEKREIKLFNKIIMSSAEGPF
jgi:hypothetical protein